MIKINTIYQFNSFCFQIKTQLLLIILKVEEKNDVAELLIF